MKLPATTAGRDFALPETTAVRLLGAARAALTTRCVQEAVQCLTAQAIEVAPLKGALWHRTLYRGEEHLRTMCDVDLLVPKHAFRSAQVVLMRAGFRPLTSEADPRERAFRSPTLPLDVDLHGQLFPSFRYTLRTRELFARARPDEELFGSRVWVLDPLDQVCHLLGHFVGNHQAPTAREREDLARLVADPRVTAQKLAARLEASGMARAGHYALRSLPDARTQEFAAAVLQGLGEAKLGKAIACLAGKAVQGREGESLPGTLGSLLCARSLPAAAAASVAAHAWKRRV